MRNFLFALLLVGGFSKALAAADLTPPVVAQPLPDLTISKGTAKSVIALEETFGLQNVNNAQFVRFRTELGDIDIELLANAAPKNVANFLSYVNRPAYNAATNPTDFNYTGTFIHASTPGVSFGGGLSILTPQPKIIFMNPAAPVANEFSVSNTRGTLAMVTESGDPDSATCEWFFNEADNSATFDKQNGGATVFGRVIEGDLATVDAIGAVPVPSPGPWKAPYETIPLQHHAPGGKLVFLSELVMVRSIKPIALTPAKAGDPAILKLRAKSSKPGLVTASLSGSVLTLRYMKGKIGAATITVGARNTAGSEASVQFTATVQ